MISSPPIRPLAFLLMALTQAAATAQTPPVPPPAAPRIDLKPADSEKCLAILKAGLLSEEFWPAMHAAEALTLAGQREFLIGTRLSLVGLRQEVLEALAKRTPADDQQACGIARE